MVKEGHEVHWLTARIPDTAQDEDYSGIKIHRTRILFQKQYKFPGRLTYAFTSIPVAVNMAKNMDVLQFNTFVAGITGWLIAKLARKPSVLFCHEFFGHKWKHLGQNIVERTLYPYVEKLIVRMPYDAFACPSEYSKQTLIDAGAPADKIFVIPHGIDFAIFNSESRNKGEELRRKHALENHKLFGFTGRLNIKKVGHSKNIVGLLKAAKIVMEKMPDARLVLGGSGFEELGPKLKELGIEDKTIYLGTRPREEVPHFFNMLDVVVCPALAEGFCFMIGEALACGRPSVATALGAHNERIVHEDTGLLSSETPEALADAIVKILNDKEIAEKFGRRAAEETKKLTWENSIRKHLEVYQKVMDEYKSKK